MATRSINDPGVGKARSSDRRLPALAIALGLHLLFLIYIFANPPRVTIGQGVGDGAMDVSLAGLGHAEATPSHAARAVQAKAAVTTPPAPLRPTDPIKPRSVLAIVSDILAIPLPEHSVTPTPLVAAPTPVVAQAMAQAAGSSGAACDIAGAVQTVLVADPAAHGAILVIPTKVHSASNAVMMWNGQWVAPADVGGASAFQTLRTAIRQVVSAAGSDCRDREIVGPRFMLVPDGDATMVAVFGNASWRWSDLLVDPAGTSAVAQGPT